MRMATASKDFQTYAGLGEKNRREDKGIEHATIELHNASYVADEVEKYYRYVRPVAFKTAGAVEAFEKELEETRALLMGNYSKFDLSAAQKDLKEFTDFYASELETEKSPTLAHSAAERREHIKDVDIASLEEMGMLVELNETLETLARRNAATGSREHFRPDILYERAENKAAGLIEKMAAGHELQVLHQKLLKVYVEREKLLVTKMAKDRLRSNMTAPDVANEVRNYELNSLRINEFGSESEGKNEAAEEQERHHERATRHNVKGERLGDRDRATRAGRGSRTTGTGALYDAYSFSKETEHYAKHVDSWVDEIIDKPGNAELKAALGKHNLTETQAATLYRQLMIGWMDLNADKFRNFDDLEQHVLRTSDYAGMKRAGMVATLAYGKLYSSDLEAVGLTAKECTLVLGVKEQDLKHLVFTGDDERLLDDINRKFMRAWLNGGLSGSAANTQTPPPPPPAPGQATAYPTGYA